MSFSNLFGSGQAPAASGGDTSGGASTPSKKPSFGDALVQHYENKYPIMGAALNATGVMPQAQAPVTAAPIVQAQPGELPDYSQVVYQNAQPKQSGLGATILKALLA